MGKPLTPEQEIEQLRALVQEAHGVIKDLRGALREARKIAADMVAAFEKTANDEIMQFSNWMASESNRQAASLNEAVEVARTEITRQLTTTKLILDPVGDHFEVQFSNGMFLDDQPAPYPGHPTLEVPQ